MATSGSTDWNKTRDEICKRALRIIGKLDPNTTPHAHDLNTTAEALNGILKHLNNTIIGFQLFTQKTATLFMNTSKTEYVLGPSGDHATTSFTTVYALATANANARAVVLTPISATAGRYVGILTGAGSLQWSSLSASQSASGTATLAVSLSSTVTASNKAFVYTTRMEKPVDIIECYLRDEHGDDKMMREYERHQFSRIYDKDRSGEPSAWYFEPRLTDAKLYLDYLPDNALETVRLVYRRVFEDFDSMNDNPDLPPEWIRPLEWSLAAEIGPEYGIPLERQQIIEARAATLLLQISGIYNDSPRTSEPSLI